MAWVDRAVRRTENESGVSEMMGALVLMSVIAAAVGIVGVGILSQPPPQKIPAVSFDISTVGNTIYIRHEGGDSLTREDFNILLDGIVATDSFHLFDSSGSWSSWSAGNTLLYQVPDGQPIPGSIQLVYTSGSSGRIFHPDNVPTTTIPVITTTTTVTTTPVPPFPVVADFSGTPTSGFAPLTVQFTDQSTGPVTGWLWAFGDGNVSSVQNPQFTYTSTGDWPVSLTVTNGSGSNMLTRTQYITVNTPATGNIVLNAGKAAYIESGGEMQFRVTGTSSSIQVNGVTYSLNQGDTVRLVVESNEYGSIYSASTILSTFSFDDVSFYQNGVSMNRGAVGIINVNGFDQYQSTLNIYMPPASASTYFEVDGTPLINWATSSAAIRITGLKEPMNLNPASPSSVYYSGGAAGYQILGPQVTGITPGSGVAGSTVSITDLSGMYFDSGSTPTVKLQKGASTITATSVSVPSSTQIQCTFSLAGAETGQWDVVVVNPDGQTGTGTSLFTVTPGPLTASFTYTLPSSNVVHLTDTSTGGATTWDWDFGDGTAHSTVQNPPDHTYASGGTYTVHLTVTDGGVSSSSTQQAIPIFLPASHTAYLNAGKASYIELGGVMQFRVTGTGWAAISVNGVDHVLTSGDTVQLVIENNEEGSISSSLTRLNSFTFSDVSFYKNGIFIDRGPVTAYVSGYDQYQSTLNLYMPSASAWTTFTFDGTTLISSTSSSAVRITGLSGAMNFQATSTYSGYTGDATGYAIY